MINNVVLAGRLAQNPELRTTQNGSPVVRFCVAVERPFFQNGERKTDFIDCIAWRGTAEFVGKHFTKGQYIGLTGSIQSNSYTDAQGNKRKSLDVVADRVSFVGPKVKVDMPTAPDVPNDFIEITADEDLPWD